MESFLRRVAGQGKPETLLKNGMHQMHFSINFAKFFRKFYRTPVKGYVWSLHMLVLKSKVYLEENNCVVCQSQEPVNKSLANAQKNKQTNHLQQQKTQANK